MNSKNILCLTFAITFPAIIAFFPKKNDVPIIIYKPILPTTSMVVKEVQIPIPKDVEGPIQKDVPKDVQVPKEKKRQPTDNEVLMLMNLDLSTIPKFEWRTTRYIWVTDGNFFTMQAMSLITNMISRAILIDRPLPLGTERLLLLRVNLKKICRTDKDLIEMINTWEELRFEPKYNRLLTKDTLRLNFNADIVVPKKKKEVVTKVKEKEKVEWYKHTDGTWYDTKWKEYDKIEYVEVDEVDQDVLRQISPHINPELLIPLIEATGSQIPVVTHGYFTARAIRQLQFDGLAKTLYRGLYYNFAGIRKGFKKGTDEDNLFEQLGIGNVNQGITAEKIFDGTGTDARVALFRSGVTKRPRRIDFLRSNANHITNGISLLSVTQDTDNKTIDIGVHPLMNLRRVKVKGKELIFEKGNGLHGFVAINGEGAIQDQVPDTITSDSTVPPGHEAPIEPGVSCIRCHASDGGWKQFEWKVPKIGPQNLDILDDRDDLRKSQDEAVMRLAEQYHGNPRKMLLRANDDYAFAFMMSCGPVKDTLPGDLVRVMSNKVSEIFKEYWYDPINAKRALFELGLECEGNNETAALILAKLLVFTAVQIEDRRITELLDGGEINRIDWDLIYSTVATRVQIPLKKVRQ